MEIKYKKYTLIFDFTSDFQDIAIKDLQFNKYFMVNGKLTIGSIKLKK